MTKGTLIILAVVLIVGYFIGKKMPTLIPIG